MIRSLFLALVASLWLSACGNVPPAPVDRFYRLQPVTVSSPGKALPVTVQPFHGESLYAERPVVYAQASSPRQLRQYHYHLWLYPPARIVQEHLTASLGQALDLSGRDPSAPTLEGRVLGFERVVDRGASKAVVALELRLVSGSRVIVSRRYQAEQRTSDDSLDSFVAAMERALGEIYAAFLDDVRRST